MRNMQKELLKAMLVPWKDLTKLQGAGRFTEQFVLLSGLLVLALSLILAASAKE